MVHEKFFLYLLYNHAKVFQPSNIDLTYKKAVLDAANHGVEIYAVQVQWTKEGVCVFHRMLPVNLSE
jgi:DNA-binding sugar fermentation-stimulating protein